MSGFSNLFSGFSLASVQERLPSFFQSTQQFIYADPESPLPQGEMQSPILILSPKNYWILRSNLNVSSEREALKYAPALFELDDSYRYDVKKIAKNDFILIAYNPDELTKILERYEDYKVEKITFAQWVFSQERNPVLLPGGTALCPINDVMVEVDPAYLDSATSISLEDALKHVPRFVKTVSSGMLIPRQLTKNTFYTSAIVFSFLSFNAASIGYVNYQHTQDLTESTETLLSQSQLPATSIEREAIIDALKKKDKKQRKLRETLFTISTLPLHPSVNPKSPSPSSTGQDGVVLIPGSKPGEANRLLVGNPSDRQNNTINGNRLRELNYDENGIKILIETSDSEETEILKTALRQKFPHIKMVERTSELEAFIR